MRWAYTIRFVYAGLDVDIAWTGEFESYNRKGVLEELAQRGADINKVKDIRRAYADAHLTRNDAEWGRAISRLDEQKRAIYDELRMLSEWTDIHEQIARAKKGGAYGED